MRLSTLIIIVVATIAIAYASINAGLVAFSAVCTYGMVRRIHTNMRNKRHTAAIAHHMRVYPSRYV